MFFTVAVIPLIMGRNFCKSLNAALGIHVFSDLVIYISLHITRSSEVHLEIDDIPSCSGVV